MSRTLFDKLWDIHVIEELGDGWALIHVDRHLLHDFSGPDAMREIESRGVRPFNPGLAFATPDHGVSSAPGRTGLTSLAGRTHYAALKRDTAAAGIRLLDVNSGSQGIVHVVGPELGIVLPGLSVACADSHTCTNGALGALAIGIGSTDCAHVMATQTLRLKKPGNMRIDLQGRIGAGVTPKDVALHIIQTLGAAAGTGHAIEFAGSAIRAMPVEGRLTVCNLAVEMGARFGVIAPDTKTIEYVRGRRHAPAGAQLEQAVIDWRELHSDDDARFDVDVTIDVTGVAPTVTWGTSPAQAIPIDGVMPELSSFEDPVDRSAAVAAYKYMGLEPGHRLIGTPVDWVFIGSCNNARLSDLEAAADVVRGRHVAPGVTAWIVPGSESVKQEAERLGLDRIFLRAGFAWRSPGCSMCAGSNGETVPPGQRCISTSNRNFMGRQGPRARTHLASPAMAAAAAMAGAIVDARSF
ncbi:MAG TPA: 3-isopropylmalate dehydratase large subunit [Ramlibacter sp.]|uniref:3-isopropylmalate dehydratase large subunit n=1 Tax=Ramlibacter sp. TaxID=1917967 RepID=UPI002B9ADC28|nr:3-isopropylmalate dehydratase large subunit [Ramlibacter sp.]HVZ42192.1 3-isopropylmalate dehydratase large subunit [Ramlibacter sp.]